MSSTGRGEFVLVHYSRQRASLSYICEQEMLNNQLLVYKVFYTLVVHVF